MNQTDLSSNPRSVSYLLPMLAKLYNSAWYPSLSFILCKMRVEITTVVVRLPWDICSVPTVNTWLSIHSCYVITIIVGLFQRRVTSFLALLSLRLPMKAEAWVWVVSMDSSSSGMPWVAGWGPKSTSSPVQAITTVMAKHHIKAEFVPRSRVHV